MPLLVIALAFVSAVAHAEPTREDLAQAKAHFEQGQRLYDLRHYQEAVVEFETSYKLSGDPTLLYNIGQALRLGGRHADAIHYYETYLKRVPDSARRDEVERRIRELRDSAQPPNQLDSPGAPSAGAPPPPPPSAAPPPAVVAAAAEEEHRHDRLLLRAMLGAGFLGLGTKADGQQITVNGGGPAVVLDLGWAWSGRFAVYGEAFAAGATGPKTTAAGLSASSGGNSAVGGVGVGGTYFVMPQNVQLSLAVLGARASIPRKGIGGGTAETRFGPAVVASLGKEWWLSRSLGFGLAGVGFLGSMKDSSKDKASATTPTWTGLALALAASLTFN
jgi:tetratricopeptide (TPR) repeat protein